MKVNFYSLILSIFFLAGLSGMSGCQKNKTEIMLDGQDTVSESETQDDTQAGNDATEDLAEAKISADAGGDRAGNDFCGCLRSSNESGSL